MLKKKVFITKLTKWEYWPSYFFYAPLIPYWIYLSVKKRNFTFWDATNPAIHRSGNGTESKFKTIQLVPEKYRPKTILVVELTTKEVLAAQLKEADLHFPLIAKPDIGFRGLLVEKMNDLDSLYAYLKEFSIPFIVQELVYYPNEIGVLYHRKPDAKKGKITSVTIKAFLTVIGNGSNSIMQLIQADDRAFLYLEYIKKTAIDFDYVPKKDETIRLLNIGNHCRGARFVNGDYLINNKLVTVFDTISELIPDWYYGRLDIRYDSIEKLLQGEEFKILEINGVISEPTHIYDASNTDLTYIKAVKTIKTHWKIIYEIASYNLHHTNFKTPSLPKALKEVFKLKKYSKRLEHLAK